MKKFLFLGLLAAGLNGSLSALPITLFNTGVNGTGIDTHYSLVATNDSSATLNSAAQVITSRNSSWAAPLSGSSWINTTGSGTQNLCGSCYYAFATTFDLSGLNPLTAVITGQVLTDDSVAINLNGAWVSSWFGGYSQASSFTIGSDYSSAFQNGVNTLAFVVVNTGGGPSGLDVKLSGTANASAVPEPGALGMVAGAGAIFFGLGIVRRRNANRQPAASQQTA